MPRLFAAPFYPGVRDGHLPAAGALIGMVMKDTKGQADAAKVRALLLAHLGQSEG